MDFGKLSGGIQPSALSKQISSNLDSFTRSARPSKEGQESRYSERQDINERSLRAGRIYREVADKVAAGMGDLSPEQLLDLGEYLEEFQQDLKRLVEETRARIAGRKQAAQAEEAQKKLELRDRLDSSFEKMKDFVSTARDRPPAETSSRAEDRTQTGAQPPAEARTPAEARPQVQGPSPARPKEQPTASLARNLVNQGPAGLTRFMDDLEKNPASKKEFYQNLGRELKTPEGSKAFRNLVGDLGKTPGGQAALYRGLTRGMDSQEGRRVFAEVLRQTPRTPEAQGPLFQALVDSTTTPAGRSNLTAFLRDPETGTALLPTMADATRTAEGRQQATRLFNNLRQDPAASTALLGTWKQATANPQGLADFRALMQNLEQEPAASRACTGMLATATGIREGLSDFTQTMAQVSRDPQAATATAGVLARSTETPEGLAHFTALTNNVRQDPGASAAFLGALAKATESDDGMAKTSRMLANVSQDPAASTSLVEALASASGTEEGRAGAARLLLNSANNQATATALMNTLAKAAESAEGRQALGTLLDQAEVTGGFLQMASTATRDAQGRAAFDQFLQDLAQAPTALETLKKQVAQQVRTSEGTRAFLALADNLVGDAEKQKTLLTFLLPSSTGKTPGTAGRKGWEGVGSLAGILEHASKSGEGATSLAHLLSGAASAQQGREALGDLMAWLRANSEARNDFIRSLALGLQGEAGAESLRSLTHEMNRNPESRDAVLRTLAQATTGESGRSALTTFVQALGTRPEARDAMLGLLDRAVTGEGNRKTVNLLVTNLAKSPDLQATFLETVHQALATPKGQVELKNLAAFLGIQVATPTQVSPGVLMLGPLVTAGKALEVPGSPTTAKDYTDRVAASGILGEVNRDLKPTRRRTSEKVEEVKLEGHKRSAFDPADLFPASAFTACRRCSNCGFESKSSLGSCPHCSGEGRQTVMQIEVRYNLDGAFYTPLRDLVEFTPRAFKLLAEELLGADKMVFLRYRQMTPNFKQLLQVVNIYR